MLQVPAATERVLEFSLLKDNEAHVLQEILHNTGETLVLFQIIPFSGLYIILTQKYLWLTKRRCLEHNTFQ